MAGYVDSPAILAGPNKLQLLQFYFVPSGKDPSTSEGVFTVKFNAFLTQFEDQYASEWTADKVYGRMDPIATFQGTVRKISLAWSVPAASGQEAKDNLHKMSKLIKMCYPVYTEQGKQSARGAGAITGAPLVKLKFANLISSTADGRPSKSSVADDGLLGWIDGISFKPNLEAGFHDPAPGELYPMQIDLSCMFNVLHQHKMGWQKSPKSSSGMAQSNSSFPYGSNFVASKKMKDTALDPETEPDLAKDPEDPTLKKDGQIDPDPNLAENIVKLDEIIGSAGFPPNPPAKGETVAGDVAASDEADTLDPSAGGSPTGDITVDETLF